MDIDGDGGRREFGLRGQCRGTGGRGGRDKCRGIGRSAEVSRVEEVIERIHCLAARREGTVVCQSARIPLLL
jgi:hypothetical protein